MAERELEDITDTSDDAEFQKLLDEFIASELDEIKTGLEDMPPAQPQTPPSPPKEPNPEAPTAHLSRSDSRVNELKTNEKNLYLAYHGFIEAINYIAAKHNLVPLNISLEPEKLLPNFKPTVGKIIQQDMLAGWDVMIKAYPESIQTINPSASDEELLDFSEACTDNQLTLGIISYVETVIELDGCQLYYQERLLKAKRKKIEREIFEEHRNRVERCKRYIAAIEAKKFPINAERLVNNYFKTSQKDAEGAYQVLINTPATFAPIEFDKIKPRLFGLIKVKPTDGLRFNKIIGSFLKKLKA